MHERGKAEISSGAAMAEEWVAGSNQANIIEDNASELAERRETPDVSSVLDEFLWMESPLLESNLYEVGRGLRAVLCLSLDCSVILPDAPAEFVVIEPMFLLPELRELRHVNGRFESTRAAVMKDPIVGCPVESWLLPECEHQGVLAFTQAAHEKVLGNRRLVCAALSANGYDGRPGQRIRENTVESRHGYVETGGWGWWSFVAAT